MALSDIDESAVAAAMAECDELGRSTFLARYGFGTATTYLLRHQGRFYDPKAIVGVAHRQTAADAPLVPREFDATEAIARLEKLDYEVLPFSGLWWVNQGASYRAERDGGYVWAPQTTKAGFGVAHHTDVNKLRVGQRIIHYADNNIRSLGTVAESPHVAPRPAELDSTAWGDTGYLCPVDYHELQTPIPRTDIPDRNPEVGPFDVNGNVKQGYLFRIHDDHLFPLLKFLNTRIPDLFAATVTHPHVVEADATGPAPGPAEVDPVLEALLTFKNVVLEGVPGTGKSFAVERLAASWRARTGRDLLAFDGRPFQAIVLHPSSSYEDFVEGLRPEVDAAEHGSVLFDHEVTATGTFGLEDGFFLNVCAAAVRAPDKDVLVLLDELNRCNVASVFGDLLLTLEASRRAQYQPRGTTQPPSAGDWTVVAPAQLPYSHRTFFVPDNVYVIATTNTTDRSVAPLDAALRRRFAFYRLEPHMPTADTLPGTVPDKVRQLFTTSATVLRDLNDHALRPCLGPDAMLGHSYLYAIAAQLAAITGVEPAISHIKLQWRYAILPQLIDAVRGVGSEDLLDPATREAWFTDRAELAHLADSARPALTQLDAFLQQTLELRIVVEGTGLTRGARITASPVAPSPPPQDLTRAEEPNSSSLTQPETTASETATGSP